MLELLAIFLTFLNSFSAYAGFTIPQSTGATAFHVVTIASVGTPICTGQIFMAGTTTTQAYTPHAVGDTLVVYVAVQGGSISAISDNGSTGGSSYSQLALNPYASGIFGTLSLKSSVTTLTYTGGSGSTFNSCIAEYSGPVAFGHVNNAYTFSSSPYSVSVTTQDANNYVVLGCEEDNSGATETPTATAGTLRANSLRAFDNAWLQDNHAASAGSVTNSGTLAPTASILGDCAGVELRTI